jgi:hypothetical protein
VDSVEVSTVVYVPPEEAYEFLVDFEGYASYSKHLERVERHGEGGPGTEYDIHLQWWKLNYVVRSEVTDLDPPERVEWRIVKDLDAHGSWVVEPAPEEAPDDSGASGTGETTEAQDGSGDPDAAESRDGSEKGDASADRDASEDHHATRVRLVINFDADSATSDMLDLPRLVSLGWVVNKVKPLVLTEAERVVARIVEDLEGERRDVELTLHDSPNSV